ncbi:MAG: antibiotic biosynthesis monooxygenase [Oscillospiraceae bacterium]|nr:antibiotic biosynthesis monooxygenase [Oscillospiraceae bacterium]
MKAIIVKIFVKEDCIEKFKEISFYNSENSRKESGCLRFDVIQAEENPALFFLYEIYKSDEAIEEHRKTAHYKKWRETVADMSPEDNPRVSVRGIPLCPSEEEDY